MWFHTKWWGSNLLMYKGVKWFLIIIIARPTTYKRHREGTYASTYMKPPLRVIGAQQQITSQRFLYHNRLVYHYMVFFSVQSRRSPRCDCTWKVMDLCALNETFLFSFLKRFFLNVWTNIYLIQIMSFIFLFQQHCPRLSCLCLLKTPYVSWYSFSFLFFL